MWAYYNFFLLIIAKLNNNCALIRHSFLFLHFFNVSLGYLGKITKIGIRQMLLQNLSYLILSDNFWTFYVFSICMFWVTQRLIQMIFWDYFANIVWTLIFLKFSFRGYYGYLENISSGVKLVTMCSANFLYTPKIRSKSYIEVFIGFLYQVIYTIYIFEI